MDRLTILRPMYECRRVKNDRSCQIGATVVLSTIESGSIRHFNSSLVNSRLDERIQVWWKENKDRGVGERRQKLGARICSRIFTLKEKYEAENRRCCEGKEEVKAGTLKLKLMVNPII